jgi:hypothetical protein
MSAPRARGPIGGAPRPRRAAFAAAATAGLAAGLSALAAGNASLAAPLLAVTYLVLIPAALLA